MQEPEHLIAFDGMEQFAQGTLVEVTRQVRARIFNSPDAQVLVFSQQTGQQIDIDLHGTSDEGRSNPLSTPAPGRPKLGVVGREVTLLPRHWQWLSSQSGGASVALRKLVELAMRENVEKDRTRLRHEAAYKFMTAMAGDLPGYEEALRSLFANDRNGMRNRIAGWPVDVQRWAMELAFPSQTERATAELTH